MDHLGEDWALPRETTGSDGVSTLAVIEDAGRSYPWNNLAVSNRAARSPSEILMDVMTFCGDLSPVVRVEALADWMDVDDEGSYEARFYGQLDPPARPANRQPWAPAELLRVHDFSAELFQPRPKTAPDDLFGGELVSATVVVPALFEDPMPVNVNTAGRDVLMGLTGLEQEAAVRAVLALRQVQPFQSLGMMFMANPELAAALEGSIGTASTWYCVRARASLGDQHRSVRAWVRRDDRGDIRILQWWEGEG